MPNTTYGSGEYSPTPSRCLPSFANGIPTGYTCTKCGHMQKELDPIFDDLCLICLKEWAIHQGVSRLIPTADAIEQERALIPTIKINNNEVKKDRSNATTIIIKSNKK